MSLPPVKTPITIQGDMSDWAPSDEIDYGDVSGYSVYARAQGDSFYFRITAPVQIGANTTIWLNTDQNTATGFQIFGFAGGAEYNINFSEVAQSDGTSTLTAALYNGADGAGGGGGAPILDNLQFALSPDGLSVELAVPKVAIGGAAAIDTLYDVNNLDSGFLPNNYSGQPYTVFTDNTITRTDPTERVGIVWSDTTAANYFSPTAYSDLFMAAETQAMQAGIPFDILTEADLTDLSKLANYDALIFPSFTNVQSSQVTAITNTLEQAGRQFGVGLITSGDFMTNDQTGAALADPYGRMNLLFNATRAAGGNSDNVTITSSDTAQTVLVNTAPGAQIQSYSGVGWNAYTSVNGAGQTIATETINGTSYAAVMATQTATSKNVLFSSNGVMADSNLLGDAISYVVKPAGLSVSLDMTRDAGIFATRMDMDQSQFPTDVSPVGAPGIYDKLIPILQAWKTQYNFVGSYYVDLGDNPNPPAGTDPSTTNWTVSLPAYQAILAMGGEIGTHSYTHLINPPTTTATAHASIAAVAGATQVIVDSLPAFAGVTVGMIVTGAGIGSNTPLPGAAGEGGAIANTTVTAVQANGDGNYTLTLSYVPGGFGTPNVGVLGTIPAGESLTFSVPAENTNFLETGAGTVTTPIGSPFTYAFEFGQSKSALEQALGITIYGAAVPGATETYATSQNIMRYFPSVAATATTPGYTGYVTGGWTGIGSGYPSAFGYMSPANTNTVYLAPNMTFDFSEIQYEGKSVAQAEADWLAQMNAIAANAVGAPIFVLPIHDYGAAAWDTSGTGAASPYSTDMYSYILSQAAGRNYEFVTLEDLASRIQSFDNSGVITTVNGNIITANVASGDAGEFALDVGGQGTDVIQNVANWYAYDDNSVFLPTTGGGFTITMGATADAVTHITSLPMRSDLLSVTGDGRNLSFSVVGDGEVDIALGQLGPNAPVVSGATSYIISGNQLAITLVGLGRHDVTIQVTPLPTLDVVTPTSLSGSAEANATITVFDGTTAIAVGAADSGGHWTIPVALAAGTHPLTVTATLAGSASAPSNGVNAIIGTPGADTLVGIAGVDAMFGGAGNDTVTGGSGNDTFGATIGDGNDSYNGGAGTDTYDLSGTSADATVNLIAGTSTSTQTGTDIFVANSVENVTGGAGNDTLAGNGLANVLIGGAGNDSMNGRVNTIGGDTMIGGLGNDSYIVNNAADIVTENAGEGTDTVFAMVNYALAVDTQVESLRANMATGLTLTGNAFSTTIMGNAGNDTLTGGSGNDTITGAAGNDTLFGGAGNDTLDGGTGNDAMAGGTGNDTYIVDNIGDVVTENPGEGTDTVKTNLGSYGLGLNVENLTYTGAGGFTGTGNTLANVITGGIGNDTLDGGSGADTMVGGAGNDTYFVDNVGDVITEVANAGIDTVDTTLTTYALGATNVLDNLTFIGGNANFTGTGNGLANVITGGGGNDNLNGGNGNDTLIGGAGADTLTGGGGADVFDLVKGDANGDLIVDFTRGATADRIDLSGYGAGAALVKGAVAGGTTTYSVQVGGVTQDTFKLNGNVTLALNTDYRFV